MDSLPLGSDRVRSFCYFSLWTTIGTRWDRETLLPLRLSTSNVCSSIYGANQACPGTVHPPVETKSGRTLCTSPSSPTSVLLPLLPSILLFGAWPPAISPHASTLTPGELGSKDGLYV